LIAEAKKNRETEAMAAAAAAENGAAKKPEPIKKQA
jgi:hypothetical protein